LGKSDLSINTLTGQAVDRMAANAARLRISVSKGEAGETIIDAGKKARGGIEAGLAIAEICLGGMGTVGLAPTGANPKWPFELCVRSTDPVIACLASQYAGWALSHGEGKSAFFALGSGPGRALARKEPLFSELDYRDNASRATLVLESDRAPPREITEKVAHDCRVPRENVSRAAFRSSRACWRSRCIKRMSSNSRCPGLSMASPRRRCHRRIPILCKRWGAPTMQSSMAVRRIFS
jgi:methenyltetrahydromethanopterin cyclohydrolase